VGLEVDPFIGDVVSAIGSWNSVWDLARTHGTQITRQYYGVYVGFVDNL
jgi:hypothetical protein